MTTPSTLRRIGALYVEWVGYDAIAEGWKVEEALRALHYHREARIGISGYSEAQRLGFADASLADFLDDVTCRAQHRRVYQDLKRRGVAHHAGYELNA